MRWIGLWLVSLSLLSACAPNGAATSACSGWKPIYVSRADVLTADTARQILAHNETGARICGW